MKIYHRSIIYSFLVSILCTDFVQALNLFGWNKKQEVSEQIIDAQGAPDIETPGNEELSSAAILDSAFRSRKHPLIVDIPGERTVYLSIILDNSTKLT